MYIVKRGDTLSSIAKANRSRVSWIVEANEIENPRDLQSGRKIFIPQETNER
jgi:LysM repeat protein